MSMYDVIIIQFDHIKNSVCCMNGVDKLDRSRGFNGFNQSHLTDIYIYMRDLFNDQFIRVASTLIQEISLRYFTTDTPYAEVDRKSEREREIVKARLGHGISQGICPSYFPSSRPRWFCQCKLTCQFAQCIAISDTLM